ncbi:MAG TPA: hypothetical protein VG889_06185 [Rhizomicrobium sp.]|nr:hypothetical protein [Rhizomicrobium sp.]
MSSRTRTAVLIRIVTIGFGVLLFLDQMGLGHPDTPMTPARWVALCAPAFFLWAVWAASSVFIRLDRGEAFGPAMIRGLNQIGAALMLGAFCAILLQPSVIFLIGNGFRELRGVKYDYNLENLTLVLVGLMLVLLAQHGRKLKSNLDAFV